MEKSKNARNKQVYKATIKQKYIAGEKSVVVEFEEWLRQKERQEEIEKLLFFKDKKMILDKSSFGVVDVEKKKIYIQSICKNHSKIVIAFIFKI